MTYATPGDDRRSEERPGMTQQSRMTELRIALKEGNQILEEALRGMGIEPDPTFEKPPGWIEMEKVNFTEESISETGALVHDLEIVLQMLNDLQSTIEGQQAARDIESSLTGKE